MLSHLSELERRITAIEMPSSESLMTKSEEKAEEAIDWAADAVEMLRRIRSEGTFLYLKVI